MVIHRSWQSAVADKEIDAQITARELGLRYQRVPVDLEVLAQELNVEIRLSTGTGEHGGSLARSKNEWIVHLPVHPDPAKPEQRFTIAHELAHVLFLEAGLRVPWSREEYWILESACDRVANCFLAPTLGPTSAAITPEEILNQYEDLSYNWLLPGCNAARLMCENAPNLDSAIALRDRRDGTASVAWSVGEIVDLMPGSMMHVDDGPLLNVVETLASTDRPIAYDHFQTGMLVGIKNRSRIQGAQLRLDLGFPGGIADRGFYGDMATVFCVADAVYDDQMRLPF